jgi:hypothetical protein
MKRAVKGGTTGTSKRNSGGADARFVANPKTL